MIGECLPGLHLGRILLFGFDSEKSCPIFWSPGISDAFGRAEKCAQLVVAGRLGLWGGCLGSRLDQLEISCSAEPKGSRFVLASQKWAQLLVRQSKVGRGCPRIHLDQELEVSCKQGRPQLTSPKGQFQIPKDTSRHPKYNSTHLTIPSTHPIIPSTI